MLSQPSSSRGKYEKRLPCELHALANIFSWQMQNPQLPALIIQAGNPIGNGV